MRAILGISLLIPTLAGAAPSELVCPLVGGGLIQVDGLLDDWPAMRTVKRSGADGRDAALALRCAYDETTLFVAVNVTDDRLIRTKKGGTGDRLLFALGDGKLEVLPSSDDADAGLDLTWRWLDKKLTAKVDAADSLQRAGWSVELSIPLARIPGWGLGGPWVPVSVDWTDVDKLIDGGVEDTLATGLVALTFEAAARTFKLFLEEIKARPADVTLDVIADFDGEPGVERVVVAGRTLGILSAGFAFLELPVTSARDLLAVQIVDLGGAGKASAVVHYRERGNGGSREVVAVWSLRAGAFVRVFAHEVAKQLGSSRMTNRWEIVPRKKGKARDLVIAPGELTGFTVETWNETPAMDMAPILLPWADKKLETWHFDRDEVSGG
jgi:hypothetical protein